MPYPIRQNVDRLKGLNRTERSVLGYITELAEHGGKNCCYASNETIGNRLQASPRTVSRTVAVLLRDQLLISSGHTSQRQLRPSPLLRRCYASASNAACAAATQALGEQLLNDKVARAPALIAQAIPGQALANPGPALTPTSAPTLANAGRAYKETRSYEKKEEKNEHQALRAELARAKKKIAGLELQLAKQAACSARESEQAAADRLATPSAQSQASHTRGAAPTSPPASKRGPEAMAHDPSVLPPQLPLPFATQTFRAAWLQYRQYQLEQHRQRFTGGLQEQAALTHLAKLAANDESTALALIAQAIRKGWKNLYPLDSTPHALSTTPFRTNRASTPTASHRYTLGNPRFASDRA